MDKMDKADNLDMGSLMKRLEAAQTQRKDQVNAAGTEIAITTRAVYDGLVEAGFTKREAMALTKDAMIAMLVEGVRRNTHDGS